MPKERKQKILDTLDDLLSNFLYYDRKEDEDLPRGAIEQAIKAGEISIEDLVAKFRYGLYQAVK